MSTTLSRHGNYAAIFVHSVKCPTQKPIKASFNALIDNVVVYSSPETPTNTCHAAWDDQFTLHLSKKQADEGLLELNFFDKKTSIGQAHYPLRTLCAKHYVEKAGTEAVHGDASNKRSNANQRPKSRINGIIDPATDPWKGFHAQLIKSDTVRGAVYLDTECTSVGYMGELLSAFKTYYVGVDNLLHLAQHDHLKFAMYITPDILAMLKVATLNQLPSGQSTDKAGTPRASRAVRDSQRLSKGAPKSGSGMDILTLAALEQAFHEHEVLPEDRYLLLALWRHMLSCPSVVVKTKLMTYGILKIAGSMLEVKEDAELVLHFLEGLKYFFVLASTQKLAIKPKKKGLNLVQRLIAIISQQATTPTQGQVVMRAMDMFSYFDEPDSMKALIDNGILAALTKIFNDASAFMALRTKALDLFRIFPSDLHKTLLATGLLNSFADLIASPSTRATHHSFLSRIIGFLHFLAKANPNNLSTGNLLKNLVALLVAKNSTEMNKVATLNLLNDYVMNFSAQYIEFGLPKNLLTVLADSSTGAQLRAQVLDHLSRPEYLSEDIRHKIIESGVLSTIFSLLSVSNVEEESTMARLFLAGLSITPDHLEELGLISVLEFMTSYDTLVERSADPVFVQNLTVILDLVVSTSAKANGPIATIQQSKLPKMLVEILKRSPNGLKSTNNWLTTMEQALKGMFEDGGELPYNVLSLLITKLFPLFSEETIYVNDIHQLVFVLGLVQYPRLSALCWSLLDAHPIWIDRIDRGFLMSCLESAVPEVSLYGVVMPMLEKFPLGYGHMAVMMRLLRKRDARSYDVGDIFKRLPSFVAYSEFVDSPDFIDIVLCDSSAPNVIAYYDYLHAELGRNKELTKRFQVPAVALRLLSILAFAVSDLSQTTAPFKIQAATTVSNTVFDILQGVPDITSVLPGNAVTFLLTLCSEPMSDSSLNIWALNLLQSKLSDVSEQNADTVLDTLWKIVNSCDLSVEDSKGVAKKSHATQTCILAWKVLCQVPEHLKWLHALPNFFKTVTAWFFSKQSNFQLMALAIIEPVRWARVGCNTAEEFETWRLALNKGRLAYCSSLKGAKLDEVAKLARSFAHNGVIPEDLSWTQDASKMAQFLAIYHAVDETLSPIDSTEQAREFGTLVEWLKFLRQCQNDQVKRRFIGLLDTFHDSLFFLPGTAKDNTDWNAYYQVDDGSAVSKLSSTEKNISELRSSSSRALSAALSKGIPAHIPTIVQDNPNVAAHYQLMDLWEFVAVANDVNPLNATKPYYNKFELIYDSVHHGFDVKELRPRTAMTDRVMMVCSLDHSGRSTLKPPPTFAWYLPTAYKWTSQETDKTPASPLVAWVMKRTSGTNCSIQQQHGTTSAYNMQNCGKFDIFSDMNDTDPDVQISLVDKVLSFDPNGKWSPKIWKESQRVDIPILRLQVFRITEISTLKRVTVVTGPTFGSKAKKDETTLAPAASMKVDATPSPSPTPSPLPGRATPAMKRDDSTFTLFDDAARPAIDSSANDTESFMNRHLAKVLNTALYNQYARVTKMMPSSASKITGGPKPNWIRIFRQSARPKNDYTPIDLLQILRNASAIGAPLIGIVKMKKEEDDENPGPAPVFGFYIHAGIDPSQGSNFVKDPMAMLFSLRGPGADTPVFVPVDLDFARHAYRLDNAWSMHFGIGTDLVLNLYTPALSFANPGMTYKLPYEFMSKQARTFFTDEPPMTWEFDDVELYFRTNPKGKISLPTPSLGHLLRLLGQNDVALIQQIRWRLKFLMLSGSIENQRQFLDEIRRAQLADMTMGALEPVNNLTKRIEHPGVEKVVFRAVQVNGVPLDAAHQQQIEDIVTNRNSHSFVAPAANGPFDITFAVLPNDAKVKTVKDEDLASYIKDEDLPYITHIILAATPRSDSNVERATRAIVFASDAPLAPAEINLAYPPMLTPVDDYAKIIKANAYDHLQWYQSNAPSALEPSKQFRIGPLLMPAEEALRQEDTGLVSKSEDAFWSFLAPKEDVADESAKALPPLARESFVEDYDLDRLRVFTDPVALVHIPDGKETGVAVLSAPVRARYITIRFLPKDNKLPLFFSAVRFLGYRPEFNHYLAPPKPEVMADIVPIYTEHLTVAESSLTLDYVADENAGIINWLRTTRHADDFPAFQKEFKLAFSHKLFDEKTMSPEMFYNGKSATVFFWGGTAPTWFTYTFTNISVKPRAFMLRHGYNKNNSYIQNFDFQGSNDGGKSWTWLQTYPDHYHSFVRHGYVFSLPDTIEEYYTSFRVLQKGPYYMGHNVKGSPFMCISEFELFGVVDLGAEASKVNKPLVKPKDTLSNVDVDAALGYKTTYDAPLRSVFSAQ